MKKYLIRIFIIIFVLGLGINVSAKNFDISVKEESFDVIVNSKSVPWNSAINKSKDFSLKTKKHDAQASPSILKVKTGNNLTIQYMLGDVYADRKGHPERKTDADGYPKAMNTYVGCLPSFYINDQINHMALIGTFADSNGVIVGSPFLIGNGPVNLIVPEGAEQLQLGINDNLFRDNSGLFIVKVSINSNC